MLEHIATDAFAALHPGLHVNEEADLNGLELWNNEYGGGAATIPSSHRMTPAHALRVAAAKADFLSGKGLDLGCGNGRNSQFLVDQGLTVSALDFSSEALSILKKSSKTYVDNGTIQPLLHDIRNGLPFANGEHDFVLDAYCLCHFIDREGYNRAMNEIARVLRSGGTYLKIHLDAFDEYYLDRKKIQTDFGHVSYDTSNNIFKRHYTSEKFEKEQSNDFQMDGFWQVGFNDVVRGRNVKRSVFAMALTRR